MELMELRNETNQMIKKFVDALGMNGESYISQSICPMTFGNLGAPGKFYTAGGKELKKLLSKTNLSEDKKKFVLEEGLIVVDKDYKYMPADYDLLVTIIHETFHSNRMILAQVPDKVDDNYEVVFYDNGKFVRNNDKTIDAYIDPAQDILLESIDDSKDTINYYHDLNSDQKDDLYFSNDNVEEKLQQQYKIDEALVELMAVVAYQLYAENYDNIMDVVRNVSTKKKLDDDVVSMANIIVRHNDLELFKWMIDPITYQSGDINYDYFAHYTNDDDKKDIEIIINSEAIMPDDDKIDNIAKELSQAKMR